MRGAVDKALKIHRERNVRHYFWIFWQW